MTPSPETGAPHALAKVAIFSGLSAESLAQIQGRCSWRWYQPREPIVDYLDSSGEVFFIASGAARASIYSLLGRGVIFDDLGPGDVFGDYAAIDGAPRSAAVEAKTACLIASMSAAAFRELLQSEPAAAMALMRRLVAKVRELTTRIYEFSALAVGNRIQAEVLRMANLAPRQSESACISGAPTHAEIASRVSTHREAVTRELNRLARIGVIERRGTALIVRDVDRLAAMVHNATGE